MCDKDDLVSYLYDDLDGPARLAFERHLRDCVDCRDELTAMRAVRADLLTWSPPEPDFAFRIVNEPRAAQAANVLRPTVPAWRAWFIPAAGFAAAAVLVLAAAAGLARIEITSGPDGWTVRTGAPSPSPIATAGIGGYRAHDVNLGVKGPARDDEVWASIERRISALESASHDGAAVRSASASAARSTDAELLKVVRDLLDQSERRQKGEYAARLAQLMRDVDLKRTADLNNLRVGIRNIDQNVTEEAATHRELMNYIIASSKQK